MNVIDKAILTTNSTMTLRTIIGLLILLIACSCSQQASKADSQKGDSIQDKLEFKTGLKIEYGPNLGTGHVDNQGVKNFYVHSTAIITNDTIIPIQLQFALAKQNEFPSFCHDKSYKVFLLPQELTPDTATLYNNIVNGQHDFLNTPLENAKAINKTLNPGEYCVVTIGVLIPKPANCAAVPRAIFTNENQGLYVSCESQINKAIVSDSHLEIGVKLEYYNQRKFIAPEDACVVIPIGQISYLER